MQEKHARTILNCEIRTRAKPFAADIFSGRNGRSIQKFRDSPGFGRFCPPRSGWGNAPLALGTALPFPADFPPHCRRQRTTLQPCPSVNDTDVQLRAKLHRLSRFSPHNGPNEGLVHADDPVRYAVGTVIVHVLLLLIDGADRAQTLRLARGQITTDRDGKRAYRSTPKNCVNCPSRPIAVQMKRAEVIHNPHLAGVSGYCGGHP